MSEPSIRFLSLNNVLKIHANTIMEEGGSPGIRDVGLLEFAVAMPQSTYAGEYLHDGLPEMAAAYLFHLCQNHAFIDGNKRPAAFATVLFLALNGVADEALPPETDLEQVTLAVASSTMTKREVINWLRALAIA